MNKIISLKHTALLAVALGALGATAALAQTANAPAATDTTTTGTTTSPNGGWHHHHHRLGMLSSTERAELKKDREAALAANPALKTQEETLREQFKTLKSSNPPATEAQWQALKTQHEALKTQLRSAMEGVDSGAAALFQKIDAAKAQHQQTN